MEAKGLACGKTYFVLGILVNLIMVGWLIFMILIGVPPILTVPWGFMTIYFLYLGAFACTKYYLDDDGIRTDSFIPKYCKNCTWIEVKSIEETLLASGNCSYTHIGEYYVIAFSDDAERERGLIENMNSKEIICVPMTPKTKECMDYYAQKHQVDIVERKRRNP